MICPHCGKSIAKKESHPLVVADLKKRADRALVALARDGLGAWLKRRNCTAYRLAKLLGTNPSTVRSWMVRGHIPPVGLAAIRGLVLEGRV